MARSSIVLAVVAAVAIAAVVFAAYEVSENPTNQMFGRTVVSGPPNERVVALTYDDGPNPPYTSGILNVPEREHVQATFFVVGRAVAAYPSVVRREVRDGDAVGNHTWDHADLIVLDRSQERASLERTDAAIYRAAGVHVRLMRPPFGKRDWWVLDEARKLGYTPVMWSVPLARDWEYPTAATIASRIVPYVKDGSIVVLHDGNRGIVCDGSHVARHVCDRSADIEATRLIVEDLRREGYRFVTIPELLDLGRGAKNTPYPGSE